MRHWKNNPHWMIRDEDEMDPDHDPPETGCESCGWPCEDLDLVGAAGTYCDPPVDEADLIWAPWTAWSPDRGQWLCMECD